MPKSWLELELELECSAPSARHSIARSLPRHGPVDCSVWTACVAVVNWHPPCTYS